MTEFTYATFLQIVRDLRRGKLIRSIDVQHPKAGYDTRVTCDHLGLYNDTINERVRLQHCIAEWYITEGGQVGDILDDGLAYYGVEHIYFGDATKEDSRLTLPYLYQYFRDAVTTDPSRFAGLAPLTKADAEHDPLLVQLAAIGRGATIDLPHVGPTSFVDGAIQSDAQYGTLEDLLLHDRPSDVTVTIDDSYRG